MGHTDTPWGTLSLVSIYLPSLSFAKDIWPLVKDGLQEMPRKQEWRFPLVDKELIRSADTSSQQKNI